MGAQWSFWGFLESKQWQGFRKPGPWKKGYFTFSGPPSDNIKTETNFLIPARGAFKSPWLGLRACSPHNTKLFGSLKSMPFLIYISLLMHLIVIPIVRNDVYSLKYKPCFPKWWSHVCELNITALCIFKKSLWEVHMCRDRSYFPSNSCCIEKH